MDLELQSYEQVDFPAFPVVFQQQQEGKNLNNKKNNHLQKNQFRNFPQKAINQLKQVLTIKHETKYPFLFTQQLSKITVTSFLNNNYKALDEEFIQQFKKEARNYQIVRLGPRKVYIGSLKDNKCHGKCILIFKNGNIYQGQIQQNKRNGKGTFIQANIGWYKGYFKNQLKEGQGLQVYYNKAAYKGNFTHGLRQNQGIYVDIHQNQYSGQWKLGIIHGKGFLKTTSSIFYGKFVNWLKHGQGQQRFSSNDSYKGQYQNNRFDGFGTYKWSNSAIYQGSFKNGFRHGKGKWSEKQTKYLGNYIEGLKQGYGQLYFSSGNFYKGNFINDKRQGYGQMFWTDGSFYKGEWKNGTQNGKGQIYLSGGQITNGIFQNSILVEGTPTYNKSNQIDSRHSQRISSQPRGILDSRGRALSDNKNLIYRKKLTRIDESIKKSQNSRLKSKTYFKSPQKSDKSNSKQHGGPVGTLGHHHGGRQCKCMKRLQNFRLKQKIRTKINDSRFNNAEN